MRDEELVVARMHAEHAKTAAREAWHDGDPDREVALVVMRHAAGQVHAIDQWLSARACRAVTTEPKGA